MAELHPLRKFSAAEFLLEKRYALWYTDFNQAETGETNELRNH